MEVLAYERTWSHGRGQSIRSASSPLASSAFSVKPFYHRRLLMGIISLEGLHQINRRLVSTKFNFHWGFTFLMALFKRITLGNRRTFNCPRVHADGWCLHFTVTRSNKKNPKWIFKCRFLKDASIWRLTAADWQRNINRLQLWDAKIHVAVHSCWKKKDGQLNLQKSDSVVWFGGGVMGYG